MGHHSADDSKYPQRVRSLLSSGYSTELRVGLFAHGSCAGVTIMHDSSLCEVVTPIVFFK